MILVTMYKGILWELMEEYYEKLNGHISITNKEYFHNKNLFNDLYDTFCYINQYNSSFLKNANNRDIVSLQCIISYLFTEWTPVCKYPVHTYSGAFSQGIKQYLSDNKDDMIFPYHDEMIYRAVVTRFNEILYHDSGHDKNDFGIKKHIAIGFVEIVLANYNYLNSRKVINDVVNDVGWMLYGLIGETRINEYCFYSDNYQYLQSILDILKKTKFDSQPSQILQSDLFDSEIYELFLNDGFRDGGFIYIVQDCENLGFVKIGYTSNPNVMTRVKSVESSTSCPFPLKLIKAVKGDRQFEKCLHDYFKKYSSKNGRGEWFKLEGKLAEFVENIKGV